MLDDGLGDEALREGWCFPCGSAITCFRVDVAPDKWRRRYLLYHESRVLKSLMSYEGAIPPFANLDDWLTAAGEKIMQYFSLNIYCFLIICNVACCEIYRSESNDEMLLLPASTSWNVAVDWSVAQLLRHSTSAWCSGQLLRVYELLSYYGVMYWSDEL